MNRPLCLFLLSAALLGNVLPAAAQRLPAGTNAPALSRQPGAAGASQPAASSALEGASVTLGAETGPAGTTPRLGLRGVRLGTGSLGNGSLSLGTGNLDTSLSGQGGEVHYRHSLVLPLLGYAEAGTEAQWLWGAGGGRGGSRLAADGVLAAGPVEVRLTGERFSAPLLLLRPLDTLDDPMPDPRSKGSNVTAALRARVGTGTFVSVEREWGQWAGTAADLEVRPQRWSIDGGPAVLALVNPGDLNPEVWAESQGTLTLRLGAEQRRGGAGLRLGAGWEGGTASTELSAVLGDHSEAAARWRAYDLLGPESELALGAALSDAWGGGRLGTQWNAALLLPLPAGRELQLRGTAGAAGTAAQAVLLLPLHPVTTAEE
ncbi:hypothetical protein [Deinococcus sp. SL84]|uniref:hypothetical protein n=1 Tax=Deinococcus sp. SL84 TaxID=2994663 RepID=UPI002274B286|nr:hypothetical protein [Deinococcus sp. SL84]MCY1702504.1 hypothetical protein [Deinococcus sp. SL84]